MLPLHCKEVVRGHKCAYTIEELEIQTINMNKLSRESFQTQLTESEMESPIRLSIFLAKDKVTLQ